MGSIPPKRFSTTVFPRRATFVLVDVLLDERAACGEGPFLMARTSGVDPLMMVDQFWLP